MIKNILDSLMVLLLNYKAAGHNSMPDSIIETLSPKPGLSIADIGAGGGYYSLRFAEKVGAGGKVYAVDINNHFLQHISKTAEKKGITNITAINKLDLPDKSLDMVFFRNSCHHIEDRPEYFKSIKPLIKDNGRIAVIDYKEGKNRHFLKKDVIIEDMKKAGYSLIAEYEYLPLQTFTLFSVGKEKE